MSTTGYSRSPRLLKGALIYFGAPMLIPIPNIIVFQYNPETMTRSLKPFQPALPEQARVRGDGAAAASGGAGNSGNVLSQPFDPQEGFSLTLELDATDALEHPESHPVAAISGVADRLAAIEMLMYPPGDSGGVLSGMVSISASAGGISFGSGGGGGADTNPKRVPVVLFFWGPGRIVPVRVESLSIEEQQFSPMLYPIRAKATIALQVITPEALDMLEDGKNSMAVDIAKGCYKFTRAQKELLAMANLANSVESIIGMLPI